MPRDARFGWQVKTTSRVVSYQDQYGDSAFAKKKTNASSTFGASKREWFKPKKTPCPAQYELSSSFRRCRSSSSVGIPDKPSPRNMSMYRSQNFNLSRPGPASYNTSNYQDLGSVNK